jgi:hypothetical protein
MDGMDGGQRGARVQRSRIQARETECWITPMCCCTAVGSHLRADAVTVFTAAADVGSDSLETARETVETTPHAATYLQCLDGVYGGDGKT